MRRDNPFTLMKRFFTAIVIIIAAATSLSAQFRYGVVAGPNLSSLEFKQDLVSVSQAVGGTIGLQGELMFPGIGFGVDMGLLYNQLGAKVNLGEKKIWASEGYGDERVWLHYLQIPFHLRFKYTRLNGFEEKLAPFVYGGPDFTILVGHGDCKAFKYAGGYLGLTAGAGAELWRNWQVSASYTWGMTYALKTRLLDDFSAKNDHWTVRVAYFF